MKALSMGLKKKYNKFTFYALIEPSQKGQTDSLEGLFEKDVKPAWKIALFYNFFLDKTVDLCYNTKRAKGNACGACF